MLTNKVRDRIFGNPIVDECNELLHSCKTKKERIDMTNHIRSKIKLDFISNKLLGQGLIGNII